MRMTFLVVVTILAISPAYAQKSWTGKYEGNLNGEAIILTLAEAGAGAVSGTMTDALNKYDIAGTVKGNTLKGTASEKNLGLVFDMDALLLHNKIQCTLSVNVFGTVEKMEIDFMRSPTVSGVQVPANKKSSNPVASKSRDSRITGTWVKESNYSSGSGFGGNYGSMSSREVMVFNADGTLTSGGSSVVVGGNDYNGSSANAGGDQLKDVFWYTGDSRLYLYFAQNNQTAELGRYYIENGKMLITGTNGEKLLLYRD